MDHYWTNTTTKSNEITFKVNIKNMVYTFISDNAVFSKEKLDFGTRLLIENLLNKNLSGSLLDLGCGYGPVTVILGNMNDKIKIDSVDINERAVFLTEKNVKLNNIKNANVFVSNIYENINKTYDYIVTNPPIRCGKDTIRSFLKNAIDYLNKSGELWFVMRKNHGALSIKKELETIYDTEIINKEKGFYIIKCIKKM